MKHVFLLAGVRKLLAPALLVAALAALAAAVPLQARPNEDTVTCGQRLTRSVKLANDLVDCSAKTALVIAAPKITVDLNGHTIDGTGSKKPFSGGIQNGGCGANGQTCKGYANVTIENGTISDFNCTGVEILGARGNVVRNVTVRKVGAGLKPGSLCAGIFLMQSTGTRIADSTVSNQVQTFQVNGIDVYASPGTRVERSHLSRNAGDGISVFQSPRSRFVGDEFDGNKKEGLHVNSGSNSTWVSGNRARGNRTAGIAVGASTGLRVLGNSASGNGEVGLLLFDLRGSLIRGNQTSANANGIVLYGGQAGVAQYGGKHGSMRNQLVGNKATKNARAGILVRGDGGKEVADDNLLAANVANANGRDGGITIQGSASGNRLRGNTANSNRGRGITAVGGTIDAGGNRARGNKRGPQCVGVKCR